MVGDKPTKKEQMEALIKHRAYDLVMKYAPSEELDEKAYAYVFTVKRNEVFDYVVRHYQLADLIPMKPSDRDGFYAIPTKKGYKVYEQYNTIKTSECIIVEKLDVWNEFVDHILGTSLTGLDFNYPQA